MRICCLCGGTGVVFTGVMAPCPQCGGTGKEEEHENH